MPYALFRAIIMVFPACRPLSGGHSEGFSTEIKLRPNNSKKFNWYLWIIRSCLARCVGKTEEAIVIEERRGTCGPHHCTLLYCTVLYMWTPSLYSTVLYMGTPSLYCSAIYSELLFCTIQYIYCTAHTDPITILY